MTKLPDWLAAYEKTGETAQTSNNVIFELYKLDIPQGETVTIGGNEESYSVVNYTVFAADKAAAVTTTVPETTAPPVTTATEPDAPAGLIGDANDNGTVDLSDAVAILQYVALPAKYGLSEQGKINADCYAPGDGITGMDALAIQMLDAEVVKKLPVIPE